MAFENSLREPGNTKEPAPPAPARACPGAGGGLSFSFHRVRFWFRAGDSLHFRPYTPGNLVRGAFGSIFRKLVCVPDCPDARTCAIRAGCPYARVFEPRAARGEGPSGLADWPRPFVFRAAHLDGVTVRPGIEFYFDAHLFDVAAPPLEYFVLAFAQLAREGLGPGRGKAELRRVEALTVAAGDPVPVFNGESFSPPAELPVVRLSLAPAQEAIPRVRVQFVTPTELKSGQQVTACPVFGVLFRRIRDRLSTLRALYGEGPLDVDFRALGERAARVALVRWDGRVVETERRSGRTGQAHGIGGFVGEAEYAGDLAEFVPYLKAARWVGVGRHTVWGNGEVEVR